MHMNTSSLFLLLFLLLLGGLIVYLFSGRTKNDGSTLEMVHVIFRHGNRNPEKYSMYPACPYLDEKYYPEGYGQLTNAGRKTAYNLGIELHKRYGDFLEKTWTSKHLEARSSDFDRTKMSLLLVLAGMYSSKSSDFWTPNSYWQPILYNYVPKLRDKELWPFQACSNFHKLLQDLYKKPDISKTLQKYNETFNILSYHTKRKIDLVEAFLMSASFKIMEELGLPLEEWTKAVHPERLFSLTMDKFHIMTSTDSITRIVSGFFLKKVLSDIKAKIEGTLKPPERKMFLYAGHEINLGPLLFSLKAFNMTKIPSYGAYILFEVHCINNVYGIKLFYQNFKYADPIAIKLPECDYFCPYHDFYRLVKDILPESDEECFGPSKNLR